MHVHARLDIQDQVIVEFLAPKYMNEIGHTEANGDEQSDSKKTKVCFYIHVFKFLFCNFILSSFVLQTKG